MNKRSYCHFLLIILLLNGKVGMLYAQKVTLYPSFDSRIHSPGKTIYYIDPQKGNDQNSGTIIKNPWKTFKRANQLIFSAGDKLMILAPGKFHQSLVMMAGGNKASPVTISFAPGRYDFYPDSSFKTRFNISNTNDTPLALKAIALYFVNSKYVRLNAPGVKIVLRGKMIETCIDKCENINVHGISFDYARPTVSELKVINVADHYADLKIHGDSKYSIKDSLLTWEGEGWRYPPGWYWQVLDPKTGDLSRVDMNLNKARFANIGGMVRVFFAQNPGFKTGIIYQTRDVTRDCAGIFMQRSKNISLKNIHICFMHGMGVVSQFCENITIDSLSVKPDKKSGRTCSAWADILHFSGCRGMIAINNCFLSAANDDAINVHGTYLKILENPSPNQIKVRFMHNQTYGFDAFKAGDSIDFIHSASLLPFGNDVITATERLNDKEILLMLQKPVPADIMNDGVVENISWTPKVWIHNTVITKIPTRGILITTRRKVIIENCTFRRVHSNGILVEDDAESWYESGIVKDLTIRKNNFVECGEPVVSIHPENKVYKGAVHQNISIIGNRFILKDTSAMSAQSVSNISFSDNEVKTHVPVKINGLIELKDCQNVKLSDNKILIKR
ncbi:right-handed parallel beta-helix repeat-containing protein [Mucilaginibacter sp. BJC16-A38]|uniref:right-handed parallel beta-helix repeat-containing protein n=1 Tax=Mucilaginibacter phenanthrenivorans TaxID=1234842 RepID=UPI002158027B|nr:right-handed parallel beta-helix repeat-containing protein [Mucilaginibacter phenanthrenivorans]MCR8556252.1 right-handed parallel beta-helix repeat-containing protein [Mucilaginibacter phenanthrenivorans]